MPEDTVQTDAAVERELARRTRRSFAVAAVAALGGAGAYAWLSRAALDDGIPWPLRRVFELNARASRIFGGDGRLAPIFPPGRAIEPRVNGQIGLSRPVDVARWSLQIEGLSGAKRALPLAAIRGLPRVECVVELKCIEGWSTIVHWAGTPLRAFVEKFLAADVGEFLALETPDRAYYVGLDRDAFLHPQTLLCYEMNDAPLTEEHGAPLRLVVPTRYGIKSLKRIGSIVASATRPRDYWAERGYDWHSDH